MDRVDEADALRFLGMQVASRVDHLRRETWSDEWGQPLRAAPAGRNPQTDFRLRKAGILRGETNIAGEGKFATAAECIAIDRGDDRLRQAFDGVGERLPLAPERYSRGWGEIDHLLDIGARGERAVAGTGEDDDPDRAILTEGVERGVEEIELFGVESVESLRAVHRDHRDALVDVDVDRHVSLFSFRLPRGNLDVRRRYGHNGAHFLAKRSALLPGASASPEQARPSLECQLRRRPLREPKPLRRRLPPRRSPSGRERPRPCR